MRALLVIAALAATPPAPTSWVTDTAGMMSPGARQSLDARLAGYERATGHQVIVWTGRTIGGDDLADWAVRTFAAWKIGRKGQDDGVALFVLADDKKLDIEVGYGLEDRVTDAQASRIIREVIAPRLQQGDADGAITDGANAILADIEGAPWQGQGAVVGAPRAGPRSLTPAQMILGGLALVALLLFAITHPRMALFLMWSLMSGGRGGGFGGGGFGGGGGGFGGGGGRSGGGGARGGW
jgi:uncharacterized protein